MSANNWAVCPKCQADLEARRRQRWERADAAYGQVSRDEHARLVKLAQAADDIEETLREDYSLGVRGGVFEVSYHCQCQCGFTYRFRHKESVPTKVAANGGET